MGEKVLGSNGSIKNDSQILRKSLTLNRHCSQATPLPHISPLPTVNQNRPLSQLFILHKSLFYHIQQHFKFLKMLLP